MRWQQGAATLERLLADRRLQRVPPSREQADLLLTAGRRHVASAAAIRADDPDGAYALLYDAARKALTAILENQGLRPTTLGGHLAVYDAARAQLDPPLGNVIRPFDRLRRGRNAIEYPGFSTPPVAAEDIAEDLPKVVAILDLAGRVLDEMSPY